MNSYGKIISVLSLTLLIIACASDPVKTTEQAMSTTGEQVSTSKLDSAASSADAESKELKEKLSSSSQQVKESVTPDVQYLTVIKKTSIRAQKNFKSKVIATPKIGEKLILIEKSGKWFKVETNQGKSGWILDRTVKKVE
ncbi:MAG: SH3 domain-containing protein [Syntrophaceae bacterium]